MGFGITSKIAVALGIVLVIVVLLEFALLNLYLKETDANFPKGEHSQKSINGVAFNLVTKDPRNINTASSWKETGIERERAKTDEPKM